ncbi:hypothetical protein HBI56_221160 [Parastagonospora nodorum]|uniref:Uncharacterized protein n=1 Tax=Phaeosphaeria nodorum (strain SN15 / ATCC MYA-4574 / FGSC 10173) TaxID=321614 RepID=A0A7U2ID50_PHANO|nr:hypothetical protein HBH56_232950 [Parastagonospora nodorum]QRD07699.1 hypothetical protein JI435_448060 [Parastagonospora nodorum SN15]KAH3921400.1 hypothetical protein HBH54_240120 [Parastagonospora nodorum]KAH3956268.1 hypothetical protein HBH51_246310 [Parastagonospora nodorum]KAH3967423.1 hypothetical protein HBH52_188840 [Parastagonospora nodorum]
MSGILRIGGSLGTDHDALAVTNFRHTGREGDSHTIAIGRGHLRSAAFNTQPPPSPARIPKTTTCSRRCLKHGMKAAAAHSALPWSTVAISHWATWHCWEPEGVFAARRPLSKSVPTYRGLDAEQRLQQCGEDVALS